MWHYCLSLTVLVLGYSGLAAELTIHCNCDIGLQPCYVECFAYIQASVLHGDVFNCQATANFIHHASLVYCSSRIRVLEVRKKGVKKQHKLDYFVNPLKACQ